MRARGAGTPHGARFATIVVTTGVIATGVAATATPAYAQSPDAAPPTPAAPTSTPQAPAPPPPPPAPAKPAVAPTWDEPRASPFTTRRRIAIGLVAASAVSLVEGISAARTALDEQRQAY